VSGSARPPVELSPANREGVPRTRDVIRVQAALDRVEKLIRFFETGTLPARGLSSHPQSIIPIVSGIA
jgi:hypothetical protein